MALGAGGGSAGDGGGGGDGAGLDSMFDALQAGMEGAADVLTYPDEAAYDGGRASAAGARGDGLDGIFDALQAGMEEAADVLTYPDETARDDNRTGTAGAGAGGQGAATVPDGGGGDGELFDLLQAQMAGRTDQASGAPSVGGDDCLILAAEDLQGCAERSAAAAAATVAAASTMASALADAQARLRNSEEESIELSNRLVAAESRADAERRRADASEAQNALLRAAVEDATTREGNLMEELEELRKRHVRATTELAEAALNKMALGHELSKAKAKAAGG